MKKLALIAATLLIAGACGGRQDAELLGGPPLQRARVAEATLPQPERANPAYLVELRKPATSRELDRARSVAGVKVVAPVAIRKVAAEGRRRTKLTVGAVDWLQFRPIAPPPTRDAEFVWKSLLEDEAILTFKAAKALGVSGASSVRLDVATVEVGGFAENGVPNIVDVLVSTSTGHAVGATKQRVLVIGASPDIDARTLRAKLARVLPGARLTKIFQSAAAPSPDPQPMGYAEGGFIGRMTFRVLENGFIDPDPAWVATNIASGTVPILGRVTCHRLMFPPLVAAFSEIQEEGLSHLIDVSDYGGCYVPRFINRDPRRGLSKHALGIAIDLNVSTNGMGTRGNMDARIVQILYKWGFNWGGFWSTPDPMHFELARIVRT